MDKETAELVERLRDNSPLPLCPFDKLAPKNDLGPEDPCPVCGGLGTMGAEDKCKGADTALFIQAADRLKALSARVDAVTDKCGKYQQVADEYKARMLELEAAHEQDVAAIKRLAMPESARISELEAENARLMEENESRKRNCEHWQKMLEDAALEAKHE